MPSLANNEADVPLNSRALYLQKERNRLKLGLVSQKKEDMTADY